MTLNARSWRFSYGELAICDNLLDRPLAFAP